MISTAKPIYNDTAKTQEKYHLRHIIAIDRFKVLIQNTK